jgi:superfamily II DNA/RNA helicase
VVELIPSQQQWARLVAVHRLLGTQALNDAGFRAVAIHGDMDQV